jgi:hypothetical protein
MILGISTEAFTIIHVLISLVGIGAGFVFLYGLLGGRKAEGWTGLFLTTTVATSATGFAYPFHGVTPGIVVGTVSLIILAIAIPALYTFHLAGAWRSIFVVSSILALYLNVFVLIAQSFQKIPALKALAPTQSEPPFLITQLVVLAAFIFLTVRAVKRFRMEAVHAA